MEVGFAEGILTTWLLLVGAFYAWRARAQLGPSPGVNWLFALSLFGAIAALHFPQPFVEIAAAAVTRSGLTELAVDLDGRLQAIAEIPQSMIEALKAPLGSESAPSEVAPEPATPVPGALEVSVVPAMVGLLASVLRAFVFSGCAFTALVAFFLRRGSSAAAGIRVLQRRVAVLEQAQEESETSELPRSGERLGLASHLGEVAGD